MRVLHLRTSGFLGGPERQILGHAIAARGHGCDVIVGSIIAPSDSTDLLDAAARALVSTSRLTISSAYDPHALVALRNWVRSQNVDLVCSHDYRSSILLALSGTGRVVPWIAFSRGLTSEGYKTGLWQLAEQIAIRFSNRIVAVSDGQARRLQRFWIPRSRIVTVRNAAPIVISNGTERVSKDIHDAFGFPDGVLTVVSAGRFTAEKGQLDLVRAARLAVDKNPRLRFVLFGDGPLRRDCAELTTRMRLDDFVRLPGFCGDVQSYLAKADIVVNPSLSEGLPNVLLEAMALGRPVIATRVGGVPELVVHEESGILTEPSDPAALADSICRLAASDSLRSSLAQGGALRVRDHFTFEGQAQLLFELYNAILSEKKTAP